MSHLETLPHSPVSPSSAANTRAKGMKGTAHDNAYCLNEPQPRTEADWLRQRGILLRKMGNPHGRDEPDEKGLQRMRLTKSGMLHCDRRKS